MTPERWQQVRGIFESAMELNAEDRAAFLDRACSADPSLRKDVDDMLLVGMKLGPEFLKAPAAGHLALAHAGSFGNTILPSGTRFGNYELRALLGEGGMGQVYRARDLSLKRDVAIKMIPRFYSSDPARLHRFKQEAEATAALNHPNILTIYQVGQHEDTFYIVAELLPGDTLRERLKAGPLPARTATDFGVQIARGLATAHHAGIIHRDLKPENIFATRDGRIKVIDFGLAKLTEQRHDNLEDRSHDKSGTTQWTEPGLVLGTTAYMSPEQVRGAAVDHRSDIFAFGAVFYEMLTARLAFAKTTAAETMAAILNEDPPLLSQTGQIIPPGMQRVIHRCLEKSPEQRFQSASDLAFALENLSDSGAASPVAIDRRRPSRRALLFTGGTCLVALVGLCTAWLLIPPAIPVVESVTQLTDDGELKIGGLASDESRVYFNEGPPGMFKLAQVAVPGGSTAPVPTKLENPQIFGMASDGSALMTLVGGFYDPLETVWSVPLPAGEPRRLGTIRAQDAGMFPDGRLVFANGTDLFVADKDGENPRKLASFAARTRSPIVSPDGRQIVVTIDINEGSSMVEVAADGTHQHALNLGDQTCCAVWTPDGKYLLYLSQVGLRQDIWALPMKTGLLRHSRAPIRLTGGPLSYTPIFLGRDQNQIFAIGTKKRGELVHFDIKTQQFLPFLSGISATDPTFSRDGKWVTYSSFPDHTVWRSRSDGQERIQLTYPPTIASDPYISPDGAKVAYSTFHQVFIIDINAQQPPVRLNTESEWYINGNWSPDGSLLILSVGIGEAHSAPDNYELRIANLRTGKISVVPSSRGTVGGLWVSQDAVVAATLDNTKLKIFDMRTQKWADLFAGAIQDWMVSPDYKYLYITTGGSDPTALRIRNADRHVEPIASIKGLHQVMNLYGTQVNVAPDGSPIFTRDVGSTEVYALKIRWP